MTTSKAKQKLTKKTLGLAKKKVAPKKWVHTQLGFAWHRPNIINKGYFALLSSDIIELIARTRAKPYALNLECDGTPDTIRITWHKRVGGSFTLKRVASVMYSGHIQMSGTVYTFGHPTTVVVIAILLLLKHHVPQIQLTPYSGLADPFFLAAKELYEVSFNRPAPEWQSHAEWEATLEPEDTSDDEDDDE